jgi:hypothetical protein
VCVLPATPGTPPPPRRCRRSSCPEPEARLGGQKAGDELPRTRDRAVAVPPERRVYCARAAFTRITTRCVVCDVS